MTDAIETITSDGKQFVHPYTTEDREYQGYLDRPADSPPVEEDWRRRGDNSRGRDHRMAATETMPNYDEQFAHRYTTEDREFQRYLDRPADPPPIVEDWRRRGDNFRGRDNRYQEHQGHRGHGWGGGRGWGGDRGWGSGRGSGWGGEHQGQQHWQDRDRHRGHGGGYQQGPRGYNSYSQRPHHSRY